MVSETAAASTGKETVNLFPALSTELCLSCADNKRREGSAQTQSAWERRHRQDTACILEPHHRAPAAPATRESLACL